MMGKPFSSKFVSWLKAPWRMASKLRCENQDGILFPIWLLFQCLVHRRKAVIIRRAFGLGDVICALPMCDEVRRLHPKSILVFVTSRYSTSLVLFSGKVDLVYGAFGVQWRVLRMGGLVEAVYDPKTSDHRSPNGTKNHLIDDLAASCGLALSNRQPYLKVPDEVLESVRIKFGLPKKGERSRIIIGISCGQTWPVREWPATHWQTLVDLIHANYEATVLQFGQRLVVGSKTEYDKIQGVQSLVSILKVDELLALTAICDLVVTIDSGPIHMSGALGIPVLGLFGPINPKYRLPISSPSVGVYADVPCIFCHHNSPIGHWQTGCPNDIRCMKELKVEVVYASLRSLLEKDGHETKLRAEESQKSAEN
jgi:ADP-heptose:LPS heptosyltransferase